jgi:hypothetical protein
MPNENQTLSVFEQSYNSVSNTNGSKLQNFRDGLIPENANTLTDQMITKFDQPNFIGAKTFNAIVLSPYDKATAPVAGTTLDGLSSIGIKKFDNLLQVKAVIPDLHGIITPLPTDLSPDAIGNKGEFQKILKLAPTFISTGNLNGAVSPGSIIKVEIDADYTEGKIIEIMNSDNAVQAALQSAKDAFDNANEGLSNLDSSTSDTTGDGAQINNTELSSEIGDCGGIGSRLSGIKYEKKPCLTKKLDATGQTITAHPQFWEQLNSLLNKIKQEYPDFGSSIRIGEAIRSQQKQYQYRLNRCPTFKTTNCVTEEQFKTLSWSEIVAKCKCKDATPTAAVYGVNASNHLLGLAVDLNMQLPAKMSCADKKVDLSAWTKCREQSKVFKAFNLYAKSFNIFNFEREPWHWSHNGG